MNGNNKDTLSSDLVLFYLFFAVLHAFLESNVLLPSQLIQLPLLDVTLMNCVIYVSCHRGTDVSVTVQLIMKTASSNLLTLMTQEYFQALDYLLAESSLIPL